jgi:hypothetical protein
MDVRIRIKEEKDENKITNSSMMMTVEIMNVVNSYLLT